MFKKITLLLIVFTSVLTNVSAQYADMGTGVIKNHIWWFDWNGFTVVDGASRDFTTDDGLKVNITFSQVSGRNPSPQVMNTWVGAVLHFLYDFSDPNIMPALYSNNGGISSYFTMRITATREGQPVPFTFLAADAEGSLSPVENTTFITSGGNWSFLDFFRNSTQTGNPVTGCGTRTIVITDTQGSMDGSPVGQNPLMATVAPSSGVLQVDVKMEMTVPGGMAVAFGIYAPLDRGDLPPGYGSARHLLKYIRSNGCNFNPPFPALTLDESLKLGSMAPDADAAGSMDDNRDGADEDAIDVFPDYTGNGSYSLQVPLTNTTGTDAWLTGSFDYNRNGVFDANELVTVAVPFNARTATLNWTGLPALFNTGDGGLFAFRFRLSSNRAATRDAAIAAEDGEVEDYMTKINSPCAISPGLSAATICAGKSIQLDAGVGSTFSWTPATGLSNAISATPVASPAVTTDYVVTVKDAGGCGGKANVRVIVADPVNVRTRMDTTVCIGAPVQLTTLADASATFSWTPATGLSNPDIASPIATPATTTRYTVTANDGSGCISTASVQISVSQKSPMSVTPEDTVICEGAAVVLSAIGGDTYEWLENGITLGETSSSITVSPDQPGIYAVNITNRACGGSERFEIPVAVNAAPATAVTSTNTVDCSHGSAMLLATGGTEYIWDDAPGISNVHIANPVVYPTTTTVYHVSVTNENNCISRDSVTVFVDLSAGLSVYPMPSAFTPNGDGKNDCFGLKYWGDVKTLEFRIFDRWGVLVFSTESTGTCWDGTFKGVLQPTGSYAYFIRAKTPCGDVERKGIVTLIQ